MKRLVEKTINNKDPTKRYLVVIGAIGLQVSLHHAIPSAFAKKQKDSFIFMLITKTRARVHFII